MKEERLSIAVPQHDVIKQRGLPSLWVFTLPNATPGRFRFQISNPSGNLLTDLSFTEPFPSPIFDLLITTEKSSKQARHPLRKTTVTAGKKNDCPLNNNCLTSSVVYNANVTTENDTTGKNYIGLTEGTFKQRYTQHKLSFRNRNYSNSTELSKHIWTLKDNNTNFAINWSILATAPAYSNISKRCHLCLTEKLYLIRAKKPSLLNKRTELISKCRHENKFYLANFTSRKQ